MLYLDSPIKLENDKRDGFTKFIPISGFAMTKSNCRGDPCGRPKRTRVEASPTPTFKKAHRHKEMLIKNFEISNSIVSVENIIEKITFDNQTITF